MNLDQAHTIAAHMLSKEYPTMPQITNVTPLPNGRVQVELDNGKTVTVDDDGGFTDWTGESNG